MCHCSQRHGDGDCKTVVPRASERRSLGVVLLWAWVFLWVGILVGLFDHDTVPLSSGTDPSWKALWEASSTLLQFKTLGPSGPGSSAVMMVLPFLKVLLDSRRFGMLGGVVGKFGGRSGCGSSLLLDSSLYVFHLFWACFCSCLNIFFG
jgi:hypothetical protein